MTKKGVITNPPLYRYGGQWVYEVTDSTAFKTEIKESLATVTMLSIFQKHPKPIADVWIIRILLILVVLFALLAGYYHAALQAEQKKYFRLEDLYVRVRGELGREETQRLIDLS